MLKLKHAQYFEGILQLRNETEELVEYVLNRVAQEGKAAVVKVKKVRGGVDLYFSSQHYLQNFGKHLKQRFSGELKVSSRLHTRSRVTGKEVHRVTVLFRLLPFRPGDILKTEDGNLQVMSVDRFAVVKHLNSGKKERLRFEQLERLMR
ncbi:hypothetical protein HY642_00095 [Candidatus Woesearchaeota archaeon]|nr:hypothetical protein [Candidatus Woesearchaeota archaeon]